MTVSNRDLHGIDAPLDAEIVLHAGPFEAVFEPSRAYLRRIRISGVESVRNVYLHARGSDWETVVPVVSNLVTKIGTDHFELTWTALHRQGAIDFEWTGTLSGSPSGIYYRCDGVALKQFKTNRTGLCVLIPREFRGITADIEHPDGSRSSVQLPLTIAPVEPLREMHSVAVGPVRLTFEGDKFEAEDQRNWTDASFKCYQLRGRRQPAYTLEAGEKMMHAVRIEATPQPDRQPSVSSRVGAVARQPGLRSGTRVLLGATVANDRDDLTGLSVDFLRVELPRDAEVARHILEHARSVRLPLQVVVAGGTEAPKLLANETLIVNGAGARPVGPADVWLGAGSFDAFNMSRPGTAGFAGIEVSATPQIHTFDERSILENAATLADVFATMGEIAPTIRLGINVHIKGDGPDPRLGSLFGALWVLRCFAASIGYTDARLTLGTASELRYPPIAALIKEFTGSPHIPGDGQLHRGDLVTVRGDSTLIGNLLRVPKKVEFIGDTQAASVLSPSGWTARTISRSDRLAPYEIVRFLGSVDVND